MKTGNIEIRMEVINQYCERFAIEQGIAEEDIELSEIETYHKAYLKFLSAAGFAVDSFNKVAILDENEYVEEFSDENYCDGDCENCEENEDEDDYIDDDDDDWIDLDEIVLEILKDHAKEVADLVAKEFIKARTMPYRQKLIFD